MGEIGFTAFGKLKTGGFTEPNSGSARAARQLEHPFGGVANVVLLVLGCLGGAARSTGSPS